MSEPEATPAAGDAKRAPSRRPSGQSVLLAAMLLGFAALVTATWWLPKPFLDHVVLLDAQRLAHLHARELGDAFDLPGEPARFGRASRWKQRLLLGEREPGAATFDLFDTARFESDDTTNAVRGYVVFDRFGDRVLSAGRSRHRDMKGETAALFETLRDGAIAASAVPGEGATRDVSTFIPLIAADGAFAGAIVVDVSRPAIEPGVLTGIERSVFALTVVVLAIAFGLLLVLTALRARGLAAQRRVAFLSQFDPLTGLRNRDAFNRELRERIGGGRRDRTVALILFDIRRFGQINDAFGNAVGDTVLRAVAERLDRKMRVERHAAQHGARTARLGADEFAAFFSCDNREQMERVCRDVASICEAAIDVDGLRLDIAAVASAALFPFDAGDAEGLHACARYALDLAKRDDVPAERAAHVRIFDADIAERHRRRRVLLADLDRALAGGEMEVHYQPQVRLEDGRTTLVGFEALLRWQHATMGVVSPAEFIPLAEQSGSIRQLGLWCLQTACREAATWTGRDAPSVAVNVSPAQFTTADAGQRGLVGDVAEALKASGLPPHRLELEITEGLLLGDTGTADEVLRGLRALGVRLALDDFGTGYSSLSYLSRIPVSKVKLDRSFVRRLADDAKMRAIVQGIATISASLDIRLLAEGVETEAEQDLLISLGCCEAQGYLHGRATVEPGAVIATYAGKPSLAA